MLRGCLSVRWRTHLASRISTSNSIMLLLKGWWRRRLSWENLMHAPSNPCFSLTYTRSKHLILISSRRWITKDSGGIGWMLLYSRENAQGRVKLVLNDTTFGILVNRYLNLAIRWQIMLHRNRLVSAEKQCNRLSRSDECFQRSVLCYTWTKLGVWKKMFLLRK